MEELQCDCSVVKSLEREFPALASTNDQNKGLVLAFPRVRGRRRRSTTTAGVHPRLSFVFGGGGRLVPRAQERRPDFGRTRLSVRSTLQVSGQTRLLYRSLYLVLRSVNRVFTRCHKFHFQKGCVWRLMYAYPVVSAGHHDAFVFAPFTMGKYLKQISRLVGTHQCDRNTSKGCGLC